MKKIAQFKSSVAGTHLSLITDVIQFKPNELVLFKRTSNGDFNLSTVDKSAYNHNEFNDFIKHPGSISKDCNILNIWRAYYIFSPEWLSDEYYNNIYSLREHQLRLNSIRQRTLNSMMSKFVKSIGDL